MLQFSFHVYKHHRKLTVNHNFMFCYMSCAFDGLLYPLHCKHEVNEVLIGLILQFYCTRTSYCSRLQEILEFYILPITFLLKYALIMGTFGRILFCFLFGLIKIPENLLASEMCILNRKYIRINSCQPKTGRNVKSSS